MASGLTDAVNSVISAVGNIPYDWASQSIVHSRPNNMFQLVRLWNDQVRREKSGKGYVFEKPACFIELRNMANTSFLENTTMAEYIIRLHIVDMQLDNASGGMDQNLQIITYRDGTKQAIAGFTPTNCSTLFTVDENQDTEHTDVYHYTLDFKTCFIDTKGSALDPDQSQFIEKDPPTNAELNIQFNTEAPILTLEITPP